MAVSRVDPTPVHQRLKAILGEFSKEHASDKAANQHVNRINDSFAELEKLRADKEASKSPGHRAAREAATPTLNTKREALSGQDQEPDEDTDRLSRSKDQNTAKSHEDARGQGQKAVGYDSSGADRDDRDEDPTEKRLGRKFSDARSGNKGTVKAPDSPDPNKHLEAPKSGGQSTQDTDHEVSVNDGRNPRQMKTAPSTFEAASKEARKRMTDARSKRKDSSGEPAYRA